MNEPFLPPGKLPGDLLDRLIQTYRTRRDPAVIIDASYGFDAAAIQIGGETIVVKSDPITFATSDAARYLVAVNANDLSCLGGVPRWMAVVGLLPENSTTRSSVERLFADLQKACESEGVALIGGHTEITVGVDRPLLIGTMLGTVGASGLLEPGKAQPGDELWLTHAAGIEGTALIGFEREHELRERIGQGVVADAQSLLTDPGISVARDARALLATGMVTAMHDPTEGGVATAIHEIASASGLGAAVDFAAIPIAESTLAICDHYGIDPLGLLSSGALLVATHPDAASRIHAPGVPIVRIGVLTDRPGEITIAKKEGVVPLQRYDSDEISRVFAS